MYTRRPRAFLSYRHEERQGGREARLYNQNHRAWVDKFVQALASWNVDVIYDSRLRAMFRQLTAVDPNNVPYLAEVSLLCAHVSQAFLPIITRGYLERVSGVGTADERKQGTVTEEWDLASKCFAAKQIEWIPVIREWPIESISRPPEPISEENSWDFRFVAPERDEVELLADQLHSAYNVERPTIDLPFDEWVPLYVKWCMLMQSITREEGLALGVHVLKTLIESQTSPPEWPNVDRWTCEFDRPRRFLRHCFQLIKEGVFPDASEGSGRHDIDFLHKALEKAGVETVYDPNPEPVDPDKERDLDEQAKQLVNDIGRSHIESFKRSMSFGGLPPGELAEGMYFGPTKLEYSHRHPADVERLARSSEERPRFFQRLMGLFKR